MVLRHALVIAAILAALAAPAAAGAKFLSVIEDLPLMPGLVEDTASAMSFDGPTGRIVEAYAAGGVDAGAIATFYSETLPQLGWRAGAAGEYGRDGEVLRIDIGPAEAAGNGAGVRFTLRPQGR